MVEWWDALATLEKVFWFFAVPFTGVFLLQTLLTLLGLTGGADGESHPGSGDGDLVGHGAHPGDHGGENDWSGAALQMLTLKNLVLFGALFGWAGVIGCRLGLGVAASLTGALLVGLAGALAVAVLLAALLRLAESGTENLAHAFDSAGTIYLPVPAGRSGRGMVQLTLQGATREVEAITDGEELPTGTPVRVVLVVDESTVLVSRDEPLFDP